MWPCAAQWRGYGVQLSGVYCVELQWRGLHCCDVQLSELQWRGYSMQLSEMYCVEVQWRGGWGQVGQGHASSELLQLLH